MNRDKLLDAIEELLEANTALVNAVNNSYGPISAEHSAAYIRVSRAIAALFTLNGLQGPTIQELDNTI